MTRGDALSKLTALLATVVLVSGCSTYDAPTIDALNSRLSRLESGGHPEAASQPAQVRIQADQRQGWLGANNYVVIYVRMRNGGMMPVKIVQKNTTVFEGPRGELYYSLPTADQLRNEYAPDAGQAR
jgi:hypothetical protein